MNNAEKIKHINEKITANNIKVAEYLKKVERLRLENVRHNNKINSLR